MHRQPGTLRARNARAADACPLNMYARPTSLADTLARLSERPHRILAGGTDVYPADVAAVG